MITIIKYTHVEHEIYRHMFSKKSNTMLSGIDTCVEHGVVDKIKRTCLDPMESTIGLISNAITAHEEKYNKDNTEVW